MRHQVVGALASLAVLLSSTVASAGNETGFHAGFLGSFGFGGETETETKGGGKSDSDNEATAGFVFLGEYAIWRYFAIGLEFGVLFSKTDAMDRANQDRNTIIDIGPVLEGKYPFLNDKMEAFVKLPIGLSILIPSSDLEGFDNGIGWTVGLLFGTRYWVYGPFGLELELGWQGHGGNQEFEIKTFGGSIKGEHDYTSHQFQLRLGVLYHF